MLSVVNGVKVAICRGVVALVCLKVVPSGVSFVIMRCEKRMRGEKEDGTLD